MVIGTLSVDKPGAPNPTKYAFGAPVDQSVRWIWFRPVCMHQSYYKKH
jgi:hypothetical protein